MPDLHPMFVHFPIALLLTSVALDWGDRIWNGMGLAQAAWYPLQLGLLGGVASVITVCWRASMFLPTVRPWQC